MKVGTITAAFQGGKPNRIKDFRLYMRIVAVDGNLLRMHFLAALLRNAGIDCVLLDEHISALEGGIGAFPRRLAVRDEDAPRALRLLREAGEA
jgi:hypothetical protein